MNCVMRLDGVPFDIEYGVDRDGDYDQFDIFLQEHLINDLLDKRVIEKLEEMVWEKDFLPECKLKNDSLSINNYLAGE